MHSQPQETADPFEAAVEAVISGNLDALQTILRHHPGLVHGRSSRPHRATLLHYIAANGVEDERQRTPKNAVAVARALLDAGADPNALASMYGGECTTLSMLVSSTPPAQAGVQCNLVDVLLDYGAKPNGGLMTALIFGFRDAAETLVRRGVPVNRLPEAAGLNRLPRVRELLPTADAEERHRALALAAQHGHTDILRLMLDAGTNPNQFNPEGMHSHSTPLHQAALAGHEEVVRLLIERGALTDIEDKIWHGTPARWAEHGGNVKIADYLRTRA